MKDRVFTVISQVLRVPLDQVHEDSSPETIESWDSLKHMNLILALEEEFGIHFSDEKIMEMLNARTIVAGVSELTNAG